MSEPAEPLPTEEPEAGLLSRAISARLRLGWELTAFAALIIVGAGMRFWDLGSRALHHDESLHGFYAYQLFQGDGYVHNPLLHGPFQFFGTALTFLLTGGASDYTVRVFPALFGTILIVLPFFFRHRLGSLGALLASGLIAFSPTLLYFSRFARNDIYIAVFTLGIVICLWRYVDERKPLFLYIGAGLLGLAFATKENTYLHAAILIAFLNIWLAADFARQTREKTGEPPSIFPLYLLAYVPWAWAVAAIWPFIRGLRERLGLREMHPAAGFLIVLGTLSLPQLSAGLQVPLEDVFGIELDPASEGSFLGIPDQGVPITLTLLAATAFVGLSWNWRVWALAATAFYVPYVLLYTNFLTEIDGFGSGIWGSLDYWLAEQRLDQPRGNQPWFYYFMLLPTYELLPLVFAAPALFYYAVKGDVFRRFLVFWVVGTWAAYVSAGEKMPWLSVHTTLPAIVLAAYVLGDIFSRLPSRDKLQSIVPQALPFAAALGGLCAVGFAAFGPTGGGWIAFRMLLALAALGALVWLLRPYDRHRLTVGLAAAVIGGLSLFTVHGGIVAAFENGDVPDEMLVFTQTAPHVPDIMDRIEEAGRVSGQGKDLPIFVDSTYSWPWHWYLRDYTDARFSSPGGDVAPESNEVVLLAIENEASMQQHLERYEAPIRHPLRWWFPEFDTYKTLPTGVFAFTGEFMGSLFRVSSWENWWNYFRDRETSFPIGRAEALAYFPEAYLLTELPPPDAPVQEPPPPSQPLPSPVSDTEGRLVMSGVGSEPGALSDPSGLAVDADGNFYVADTGNHRVQKFDRDGELVATFGQPTDDLQNPEPGEFNKPGDIALDDQGNLYVVDTWNHRIQKFDRDLNFLTAFGRPTGDLENPEPDQMWGPRAIAVDADGNLVVSDTGTHRIKKFSPEGDVLAVSGSRGSADGKFNEPVGLAVAANGDVWVADPGNRRLQRLDDNLNHVSTHDLEQWDDIDLNTRPYLATLPDGRLLVTDATHSQVLLLADDGALVGSATQTGETALVSPRGIAYDETGLVYVTESLSGQVVRFLLADLQAP
jgi:uncharacterized protein (TIGR03663 family)